MEMDSNEHRSQNGFPVDQPMEALKQDHNFVKQLFDRYFNAQDLDTKKEVAPHVLMLLEMHTSLEDAVFYPKVHDVDPALVDQCENEHEQAKQLIQQLRGMDEGDAQSERMFKQLADAILKHIGTEESQLFPKVQQANLDMTSIGLQMQAFEANMLGSKAQPTGQQGIRQ